MEEEMQGMKKLVAVLGLALTVASQAQAWTYGSWRYYDSNRRAIRASAQVEYPGNNDVFEAYGTIYDTCQNVQFLSDHQAEAWRSSGYMSARLISVVGQGWNYDPAVGRTTYFPEENRASTMPYGYNTYSYYWFHNPDSGYYYFNAYGSHYWSTAGADTDVADNYFYVSTYAQARNYWMCELCPC
jgi:hypothetical protein